MVFPNKDDDSGSNIDSFGSHDKTFSHDSLIMVQYHKCLDSLSAEMKKGYFQAKQDNLGNTSYVWIPDERLIACSCVETLKNLAIEDLAETSYLKKIRGLKGEIDKKYKAAQDNQEKEWERKFPTYELRHKYQMNGGEDPRMLHDKSTHWHNFLDKKVIIYRLIFQEIERCLKKGGYFKKRMKFG